MNLQKLSIIIFCNFAFGNFFLSQVGDISLWPQTAAPYSLAAFVILILAAKLLKKKRSDLTLMGISFFVAVIVPIFGTMFWDFNFSKGLFWGSFFALAFWKNWLPMVALNFFLFRYYQLND